MLKAIASAQRAYHNGDLFGAIERFFGGFVDSIHTSLIKWRFAEFGEGSTVERGCVLQSPNSISIGNRVRIGYGTWLNASDLRMDGRASLLIGDGTFISRFVHINGFKDVVIEANVLIGEGVYIGDTEHLSDDLDRPVIEQGWDFKGPVLLKSGCYIAKGATVLSGVTIGRNAVVGPLTVVTMDVRDGAIVMGNPARVIRKGR